MTPAATRRPDPVAADIALVGPNAVIQVVAALAAAGLSDRAAPVFAHAGAADWLAAPPTGMIDAARAGRLHRAVRAELGAARAASVLAEAGRLTADYLLAARIPRPAQALLRALPAPLAARLLVPAIRAHAWTFAGAGHLTARAGCPTTFELAGNPLCAGECATNPVCVWHAAVFQRLFAALVSPAARASETACEACGDACCRFVVDWLGPAQRPTA